MAKVQITNSLFKQIKKKFKEESHEIIDLLKLLESNPKKGRLLGNIGKIVIKEIRYKSFRFYFITNGHKIKALKAEELKDLTIKFVRMSNKKEQQKTINEIKEILKKIGEEGF